MNKSIKNKSISIFRIFFFALLISLFFQPILSYGQDSGDNGGGNKTTITLKNPLGSKINNLPSFIYMILDIAFQIGAIFSVLAIIYVGFLFVKARGDPEELKTARTAFLYTVIGIAVLLGAVLIATVIQSTISDVSTGIY
ncbi:MAG: protein of unknown function with transrane region [Parcubacteria group bacterium]|nr:protein of unknown function with transrane region [Parcubacteria group bacterium]